MRRSVRGSPAAAAARAPCRAPTPSIAIERRSISELRELIETIDDDRWDELERVVTLGLNHEQQHQELFYTEIKYILGQDPPRLRRAYRAATADDSSSAAAAEARCNSSSSAADCLSSGHVEPGWCWDNELPVHRQFLEPFALADRLVTNGEYLEFMADGGYARQLLWLDNGWTCAEREEWRAPLYWEPHDGEWRQWTLAGLLPLDRNEPVSHVSFYEADAFARWKSETFVEASGARLPSEFQWEQAARVAAAAAPADAFLDGGQLRPRTGFPAQGGQSHFAPRTARKIGTVPMRPSRKTNPAKSQKCSAPSGNGRAATTSHIRVIGHSPAPWQSTTASSWTTSVCSVAVRASRRATTSI